MFQFFLCVSEQGSLTIVRRSSTKKNQNHSGCPSSSSFTDDEALDAVDLDTDNLPAVDTPDACDKAAIRSVNHRTTCMFVFSVTLQAKLNLGRLTVDVSRPHTIRHTAGRTHLNVWSARRTGCFLHNTQQSSMPSAGFEHAILSVQRLQTSALDRTVTRCRTSYHMIDASYHSTSVFPCWMNSFFRLQTEKSTPLLFRMRHSAVYIVKLAQLKVFLKWRNSIFSEPKTHHSHPESANQFHPVYNFTAYLP